MKEQTSNEEEHSHVNEGKRTPSSLPSPTPTPRGRAETGTRKDSDAIFDPDEEGKCMFELQQGGPLLKYDRGHAISWPVASKPHPIYLWVSDNFFELYYLHIQSHLPFISSNTSNTPTNNNVAPDSHHTHSKSNSNSNSSDSHSNSNPNLLNEESILHDEAKPSHPWLPLSSTPPPISTSPPPQIHPHQMIPMFVVKLVMRSII